MTAKISSTILHLAMPRAPQEWIDALLAEAPEWGIDTDNEIASFTAQLAYESFEFTRLEESLDYSVERLMEIWPKRFPLWSLAEEYAHRPEKLGNYVYADRLGNGAPATGDGWHFRGRGPIQITGRRNYMRCAAYIGDDLLARPELLLKPTIGIKSACWFWKVNNLDLEDDDLDVRQETLVINGGLQGVAQRQAYLDKIAKAVDLA